jgi:NADH-quinone oxidoreductase subunit F
MGRKILLEHIDVPGIETFDVFRSMGGYRSAEKALKDLSPDTVVAEVKTSGLRGRGGAGFSTGLKWSFVDKKVNKPRYLICNADESEPGTFKDRFLMQHLPHQLIEGIIISSFALGVNVAYIYVRGEFKRYTE